MPWVHVIWDSFSPDGNLAHIQEHGLTADDVDEILREPDYVGTSRSSGLPMAVGRISDGGVVCVIYQEIDPVTVFPVTAFQLED
jgi:hypothetical protein